jgi:hypothetical protein
MRIGEFLVVQGLVTPEAVEAALKHQKQKGGRLGQHLVAMGAVTPDKLSAVARPATLASDAWPEPPQYAPRAL